MASVTPAELEERVADGRVPSPRGQGGEFPGAVGKIDFAGDWISFEYGLVPEEDVVGSILEEQIQAGWGRIECGLGEERGDVAIEPDEAPEGGLAAVNGLPSHQLQHLLAEREGSAQNDPPRADGALDVGADLSAPFMDQILSDEGLVALRGVDEKHRPARSDGDIADAGHPAHEACGKGGESCPTDIGVGGDVHLGEGAEPLENGETLIDRRAQQIGMNGDKAGDAGAHIVHEALPVPEACLPPEGQQDGQNEQGDDERPAARLVFKQKIDHGPPNSSFGPRTVVPGSVKYPVAPFLSSNSACGPRIILDKLAFIKFPAAKTVDFWGTVDRLTAVRHGAEKPKGKEWIWRRSR